MVVRAGNSRARRGYADITPAGDPTIITDERIAKAQPVVGEQIQKAGWRLAALNAALL